MNSQDFTEVRIFIEGFSEEKAEIVEAYLGESGYDSFCINEDEGFVSAYIPSELYDEDATAKVLNTLDMCTSFTGHEIAGENWNKEWEQSIRPIIVSNSVSVRCPHHTRQENIDYDILINPEMAFGTGHHNTTYMMIEAIVENAGKVRKEAVVDLGCGTAVLGILTAKIGASSVHCIDIDEVAVKSSICNAELNEVSGNMFFVCGDDSLLKEEAYGVFLANIHKNIIINGLPKYYKAMKKGGLLLLSGFYVSDCEDVINAATCEGFYFSKLREKEGWACLEFWKK